ncbi:diaminopimelate epimerase [Isobaculum melis]|uniref:Diaminopimelate epimerase n=1 Tax=Isobaculum melis TaxID=142588 RepID=A0A1H9T7N5_9LACT|nr:diaminopimelate epimerase [Isobaculum melis]SER92749.1 diaminopimelate epimerase [Isobaculum melis]
MTQLPLLKVHGSENDFYLLDRTRLAHALSEQELIRLTQQICQRKNGLLGGADGILVVDKGHSASSDGQMRVINADGSEASMCGNGLRTVARYLTEKLNQEALVIETLHGLLHTKKMPELAVGIPTYQVEISPVSFSLKDVPMITTQAEWIHQLIPELSETLFFSVVAVPNPHLIAFVEHQTLTSDLLQVIAEKVNGGSPLFPDGANVSFVEILGPQKIFVRTYERGVGFTNACGTAMSASSLFYVLLQQGQLSQDILVLNPGGMVKTRVHQQEDKTYTMDLIGNATKLFEVTLNLEDALLGSFTEVKQSFYEEDAAYQSFIQGLTKK